MAIYSLNPTLKISAPCFEDVVIKRNAGFVPHNREENSQDSVKTMQVLR
jgi:hypothetical protein